MFEYIKFCFNLKKVRVRCITRFKECLRNVHYAAHKFLSGMPGLKPAELRLEMMNE